MTGAMKEIEIRTDAGLSIRAKSHRGSAAAAGPG
jgi:hypothetical protein